MSTRILVLTPHTTPRPGKLRELGAVRSLCATVEFVHAGLDDGPPSIESADDETRCLPALLAACSAAERDGVAAIVIDCMGDPGLYAARARVRIPVVGPGQTSLHLAATLGDRIGVLTVVDSVVPLLRRQCRAYGLLDRLACVRPIGVPVLALSAGDPRLVAALVEQAERAILEDRADALVLGCTGFLGVRDAIVAGLAARGHDVPIVHPLQAAALHAISLTTLGLRHGVRRCADASVRDGVP